MVKEKRIKGLLYILLFIPLFFISEVKALTFDNFEVTWYYRNKGNESQLLNVIKQEDVPLYASTNEYVNGYTTRVEQTFTKQIQYIVNYQLQMWFSAEQELNYRSDTLQRIIDYSFIDSDFKILNVIANENWNRSSGSGETILTINVSMQVLALNNTNAIRFGVYTNNNISIGFYNHTDEIDYYLVNNVSIEENASASIIDQNNQIINGQNNLQNSITNTEDSINQNIDDMESAIVDSNKETQDVIKDQFNDCRDSENLFNKNLPNDNFYYNNSGNKVIDNYNKFINQKINTNSKNYSYSYKQRIFESGNVVAYIRIVEFDSNDTFIKRTLYTSNNTTFTLDDNTSYFIISVDNGPYAYFVDLMLNEGSNAKPYEPYGEEICTNKLDEQNDALNNIGGALTDDSPTDMSGLGDSAGWLPAGPVDSILTLPLTLFTTLSDNLSNNTCTTAVLPLPFVKKNINLPCIKTLYDKIGITGTLFTTAGIIASCFILFNYLLSLYNWVDKTLTMRENTMPGYYDDNWGGGA